MFPGESMEQMAQCSGERKALRHEQASRQREGSGSANQPEM